MTVTRARLILRLFGEALAAEPAAPWPRLAQMVIVWGAEEQPQVTEPEVRQWLRLSGGQMLGPAATGGRPQEC